MNIDNCFEEALANERRNAFVAGFFSCSLEALFAESHEEQKSSGKLLQLASVIMDAQQAHIDRTMSQAQTDALTGLLNRRGLASAFQNLLDNSARARRKGDTSAPATVMVVDINLFKGINDTYGHLCGDDVLRTVACYLKSRVRETDIVARTGGDEFVVVFEGATEEEIRAKFSGGDDHCTYLQLDCEHKGVVGAIPVTLAAGVAHIQKGDTLEAAVERADRASYISKEFKDGRLIFHYAHVA